MVQREDSLGKSWDEKSKDGDDNIFEARCIGYDSGECELHSQEWT